MGTINSNNTKNNKNSISSANSGGVPHTVDANKLDAKPKINIRDAFPMGSAAYEEEQKKNRVKAPDYQKENEVLNKRVAELEAEIEDLQKNTEEPGKTVAEESEQPTSGVDRSTADSKRSKGFARPNPKAQREN